MSDSVMRDRSKLLARRVVLLCRQLRAQGVENALLNQLLRCGTSVGANLHEAQYAQSGRDFVSKLEIALKECNETDYWLELLEDTSSLPAQEAQKTRAICTDLRRMLVSAIKTMKEKQTQSDQDK